MKIGLLTFISNNYGTCLQAYAMRKAIESLGFEVTFIHHVRNLDGNGNNSQVTKRRGYKEMIRRFSIKRLLMRMFCEKIRNNITHFRSEKFTDFINNNILTDKRVFTSKEDLLAIGDQFDVVVCGSDMIWSNEYSRYFDIYMIDWLEYGKKISYAPSLGSLNYPDNIKEQCVKYLKSFNSLSCREKSGALFLTSLLGREVKSVIDPTLLFTKEEWLKRLPVEPEHKSKSYILVYCFGGISNTRRKELKRFSKKKRYNIRYIMSPDIMDTINETKYGDGAYGPKDFIRLFSEASFTVVNGYHGLLFSMIFEKPFVVLHREKGEHWGLHENRMSEVLSKYSLLDRYLDETDPINQSLFSLDYHAVNHILRKDRESSWDYLRGALT